MTVKHYWILSVLAGFIFVYMLGCLKDDTFPDLKGSYLGQKPPGMKPELFAPGIVSTGEDESTIVFSPDDRELFYTRKMGPEKRQTILTSTVKNGTWIKPHIAHFSGKYYDAVTSISPDGKRLFFLSMRPQKENESPFEVQNIWFMEKHGIEWRKPQILPSPINSSARKLGGFLSKDGYFYFSTSREGEISGQCRAKIISGEVTRIENINHFYNFNMPCLEIAREPNEKFIVFVSYNQPDGYGNFDLYVSFKNDNNSWTTPKNLGERINTSANEHFPTFSPDGKYMFFVSDRISNEFKNINRADVQTGQDSPMNGSSDIYWVDAKIIKKLKAKY
jgi:Tol biopolymer transport system component